MRWFILALILVGAGCALSGTDRSSGSPAAMRRADAAFQRGEFAEAVLLYRSFLATNPPEDEVVEANYRMATAYHHLGRNDEAAKVIEDLHSRYPDGEWPTVWALYGDIEQARGRNVSALLWWERAYLIASEDERGQLSARILALVVEMSDEEKKQTRPLAGTDFLRRALDTAKPRATRSVTPTIVQEATATATPGPESARIALLLPLTGKNHAIGEASLDGARVAVARDDDLLAIDTRGSASGSAAEFEALRNDVSVAAVVGPLRSEEANAVAARASAGGLALLPLAQTEGVSSPFVFQIAMTRALQAQTLAAYAVRRLGVQRFAVVHPRDTYGDRFSELFRSATQAEGGKVVGTVVYPPGQSDFGHQIDELQALQRNGGVGAVFLPDSAETVALLAPEIRRAMPELQLLGSSEWNEGFILAGVSNSLEGAIFVDGFYPASARPATRAFVETFRRRYGRRPGLLEAQAHDAVALVEAAISRGAFSRGEIQSVIQNFGLFEGASGTMEIGEGVVKRQLFLLRFRGGNLEELSW